MAFHIYKTVTWEAGEGTPPKYTFTLDANVNVEAFVNQVATISVVGTVTVSNYPTNSRNSWAASDFAVLVPGNVNTQSHPFAYGTRYYEHAIPFLPDPQNGDASKMLAQFRGDTWVSDPSNNRNKSSLWTKNGGLVINSLDTESTESYTLNTTFDIPINSSGDTVIIAWDSSGANNATDYNWLDRETWASWFDLDYRPGAVLDTNVWRSHNRSSGKCHAYNGSRWSELRTVGGPTAMGNPPSVNRSDKWYNQIRIGVE